MGKRDEGGGNGEGRCHPRQLQFNSLEWAPVVTRKEGGVVTKHYLIHENISLWMSNLQRSQIYMILLLLCFLHLSPLHLNLVDCLLGTQVCK